MSEGPAGEPSGHEPEHGPAAALSRGLALGRSLLGSDGQAGPGNGNAVVGRGRRKPAGAVELKASLQHRLRGAA